MNPADVLSEWVRVMETQSTLLARSSMNPGWGMKTPATHSLMLHLIHGGSCWLRLDTGETCHLHEGELVLITDGSPHEITDTEHGVAVTLEEFVLRAPPSCDLPISTLVCGQFQPDLRLGKQVLQGLPRVLHLQKTDLQEHPPLQMAVKLLWSEIFSPGAGSELLLTHLLDTVLLYILRQVPRLSQQPGWLTATQDPQVSRALSSMHARPEAPWTVEGLADLAGLSRAAFAKRFSDLVGQSPLAYLTDWRMNLAAKLLIRGDTPIYQVAERVGYTSEASFSRAFKRHHGMAPARFRRGPQVDPDGNTARVLHVRPVA